MEIKTQSGDILKADSDLAVLGSFEDVALPELVAGLLVPGDFSGRAGQALLLYPRGGSTQAVRQKSNVCNLIVWQIWRLLHLSRV